MKRKRRLDLWTRELLLPQHRPQISFRGDGKTTGYYLPVAAQEEIRAGVAAWQALQQRLRELAELNRQAIIARAKEARGK